MKREGLRPKVAKLPELLAQNRPTNEAAPLCWRGLETDQAHMPFDFFVLLWDFFVVAITLLLRV